MLWFSLAVLWCYGQAFPPTVTYPPDVYGAGNQNWMIAQDSSRRIYVANNAGLLEYDGTRWHLYPSPNESILRSVAVVGERIYTGSYMEIGYWTRNALGRLDYHSLNERLADHLIQDEQFWNIDAYGEWLLFQSLNQIYLYRPRDEALRVITPPGGVRKLFKSNSGLYFHTPGKGLFRIINGEMEPFDTGPVMRATIPAGIFDRGDTLLILTQDRGFFARHAGKTTPWPTQADTLIDYCKIYTSLELRNRDIALGTISDGVIFLNPEGRMKYHLEQRNGLSNNTVLSFFQDADGHVWLGLDNGVNCVNYSSPIRSYKDNRGILGTVYAAQLYQGNLYLGTNQGLFIRTLRADGDFKMIPGTAGQIWSLYLSDQSLFAGHDSGTFLVSGEKATKIADLPGVWDFRPIPGRTNLLLQGMYFGFSLLEKRDGRWQSRGKLPGFDYSSKHFEVLEDGELLVNHEYKGLFRLQLHAALDSVTLLETYSSPSRSQHSGLIRQGSKIWYANKQGIYQYRQQLQRFERDTLLSHLLRGPNYASGRLQVDGYGRLWIFSQKELYAVTMGVLGDRPEVQSMPIPYTYLQSMQGYENILALDRDHILIGVKDGFLNIDLRQQTLSTQPVQINQVQVHEPDGADSLLHLHQAAILHHRQNTLTFSFFVPDYQPFFQTLYQYRMQGLNDTWSEWGPSSTARFENLPPGAYQFQVKSCVAGRSPTTLAAFPFTVRRPWYYRPLAIGVYCLSFIAIMVLVHTNYQRYYRRQQSRLVQENQRKLVMQSLDNERRLMQLRNQQLQADIDSKNRELALSTMSLIRKNELLIALRNRLQHHNGNGAVHDIVRDINHHINEDGTWELFQEAFNNADKDFLHKMKTRYPGLTPRDLRLCAFLRLNLSSKEIAPLLNISVRSVETKRHRLRKKMGLAQGQNLVDYILEV